MNQRERKKWWDDEGRNEKLKKMWQDGLTPREIAEKFGVSLNVVNSKIKNLGLTSWWDLENRVERLVEFWEEGLKASEISIKLRTTKNSVIAKVQRLGLKSRIKYTPKVIGDDLEYLVPQGRSCAWPHGHPKDKNFHYCNRKDLVADKPYCREHYNIAYVQPKKEEVV